MTQATSQIDLVEIELIKDNLDSIKQYLNDPDPAVANAAHLAVDAKEALDYHQANPYGRGVETVLIRRLEYQLYRTLENLMLAKRLAEDFYEEPGFMAQQTGRASHVL